LSYLGAASLKQKYSLLLLSNFLIVLLFYIGIINSLQYNINNKRQENSQINNLIKKKKINTNSALSSRGAERQIYHRQLSINNILNTLEVSANKTQTIIQKIEKYNYKPSSLWDSYQIDLTVAGQYQHIINFINIIVQYYNFITFNELDLQKINTSPLEDEFTLNINLTIYHNKTNTTTNSALSSRGEFASPRDPEQSNSAADLEKVEKSGSRGLRHGTTIMNRQLPAKNNDLIIQLKNYPQHNSNLYSWSMQELQFVGSIKQLNKTIGFIVDPMGETHQITIGDKIGLKQEVITNINENGITTNAQKIN